MRSVALVLALGLFGSVALPGLAWATDVDAAWGQYAENSERFDAELEECLELGAESVSGDRVCRAAVEAGQGLVDALGVVLTHDSSLNEDDVEFGVDELLTTQQILAAVLISLNECDAGREILDALDADQRTESRRVLVAAIDDTRASLARCERREAGAGTSGGAATAERQRGDSEPRAGGSHRPADERSTGPWITIGVSAGLVVAGFAHGPRSQQLTSDIECYNAAWCESPWDEDSARDNERLRNSINRRARWLWATGGLGLAGGVVWRLLDARVDQRPIEAGIGGRHLWIRARF